jgi:hypothetical protein
MARAKIAEFGLIQKALALAVVTFYEADENGENSGVKATIYQAATGSDARENPQTLDTDGKLSEDCYVDTEIMAAITGISALTDRSIRKIKVNPLEFPLPVTSASVQVAEAAASAAAALVSENNAETAETNAETAETAAEAAQVAAETARDIAKAAGGFTYTYSSTTTAADPGSGILRFNNASLASATELYISETTGLAQAIAAEIATWDDSTSTIKTKLRLFQQADPSIFAIFNVTGSLTDNGGWDTLTVAYVSGSGVIANTDVLTVQPIRNGDKGDQGDPGTVSDGDKGDITVSGSGATWTIDNDTIVTEKILDANITLAKIANAAANSKLLGAGAAGSGAPYAELTLGTGLSMSGTTLNGSGLSVAFTSSEQTVTVNSQTTIAHGLGAAPTMVELELKCITTDLGYAVGDRVPFNSNFAVAGPTYHGACVSFNATNIYISTAATSIIIPPLAGGAGAAITTANWKWVARAFN